MQGFHDRTICQLGPGSVTNVIYCPSTNSPKLICEMRSREDELKMEILNIIYTLIFCCAPTCHVGGWGSIPRWGQDILGSLLNFHENSNRKQLSVYFRSYFPLNLLTGLSKLTWLELDNNKLTQIKSDMWKGLTSLITLRINNNDIRM